MPIVIVRDQKTPMRHDVHIGGTVVAVDASVVDGGEGSGASPHDFYDAALGACEAMTVLFYAKRKAIPVEGIEVSVTRDASGERGGTYLLNTALKLTGALTDEQRRELLSVAAKCPVHRLMTSVQTVIETTRAE